jgi:putative flippase GtrA
MIKFGIAGAVATVADFGTFILLMHLWQTDTITLFGHGVQSYQVYQSIAFTIGTIVSYVLSVKFVFSHRNISNKHVEFLVFLAIGVVGLVLTELIITTGMETMHTPEKFAQMFGDPSHIMGITKPAKQMALMFVKVVSIGLVFFYNFGARKLVMFRKPKGSG